MTFRRWLYEGVNHRTNRQTDELTVTGLMASATVSSENLYCCLSLTPVRFVPGR